MPVISNTSTTFKKKTRFQKEKEAREAKKNAELAAAASIYEDFVTSFDAKSTAPDQTFVSAGGSRYGPPSDRGSSGRDSMRGGSTSFPALPPTSASAPHSSGSKKKGMSEMERMLEEMKDRDAAASSSSGSDAWGKPGTRGGAAPSNRGGFSNAPLPGSKGSYGSHDTGDQDSTNLYVGNLAPGVTEESLMEQFGRFGDIYSIKVMWPRTDEERARQRNSGFVSFMTRSDAADAKEAMDGVDLEGYRITVGWGKAIKNLAINKNQIGQVGGFLKVRQDSLPPGLADGMHDKLTGAIQAAQLAASKAQAAHAATGVAGASSAAPAAGAAATATTGAPPASGATTGISNSGAAPAASSAPATGVEAAMAAAQALAAARAGAGGAASGASVVAPAAPAVGVEREMTDQDRRIEVVFSDDNERKLLIDHLARFVSKDGQPLENMVREREAANPEYKCLQEPGSAEGLYYRWKVWSLTMGDKERKWREQPFQMTSDGPFFIPPKMPIKKKKEGGGSDSEDSDDEGWREKEKARRAQREALRKERYKYMTGAQMEKARERQEREAREAKLSSSSGGAASGSSSGGSSSAAALPRGRPLSDDRYDDLEAMLRHLSVSKAKIAEAMALALDCADCSGDVVELLEGSLCVAETPINVKVARLYLVSDVLHNSAAPVAGASTYRTLLQEALPKVFDHLNATYRVLGRMSAAGLEEKVMSVLRVWAAWSIYPPRWLDGLEATFYRKPSELDPPTSGDNNGSSNSSSGSSAALAAVATAAAELEALGYEELERKAKRAGVWVDPKKDKAENGRRLARKLALDDAYLARRDGRGDSSSGVPPGDDDVDGEALDGMSSSGGGGGLLFPATQPAWGLSGTNLGRGFLPVDGEPLDGEPLGGSGGVDGEPLDGEPLGSGGVDGEPLDGEPLESARSSRSTSKSSSSEGGGKKRRRAAGGDGGDRSRPSKYAGLGSSRFSDESGSEDEEGDDDDEGGHSSSGHGVANSSAATNAGGSWSSVGGGGEASGAAQPPPPGMIMSDQVRQQLRQVEVAVLQLRDQLEDQGGVAPHEVEQQCAALRAQLRAQHLPPS